MADYPWAENLASPSGSVLQDIYKTQTAGQKNQLVQQEVQGRNMLAKLYQQPGALDPQTGLLKPGPINMLAQAGYPEIAMQYMQDAQKLRASQQLTESRGMEARQKFVQDFNLRLAPANAAYDAVKAKGGSDQEAQAAAQAVGMPIVQEALAAGDIPAWARPRMEQSWRFDKPTYTANALGRQGEQQVAVKKAEREEEFDIKPDVGRGVEYRQYKSGRTTDLQGNPYTPSGVAERKGFEAAEFEGKVGDAVIPINRSAMSPTGWVDAKGQSVNPTNVHKMTGKDPEAEGKLFIGQVPDAEGKKQETILRREGKKFVNDQTGEEVTNVTGLRNVGQSGAGTASDEAKQTNAELMAKYKLAPPNSYSMSRGSGMEQVNLAKKINPDYDPRYYSQAKRVMDSFASGPDARRLDSLNTVVQHLSVFDDLSKALNNGSVPAMNSVLNYVQTQMGRPEVTNFNTAAAIVADEVIKSIVGAGAVFDRESMQKNLSSKSSPAQFEGTREQVKKLMAGQVGSMKQRWVSNHAPEEDFEEHLNPDTIEAIEKYLPKVTRPKGSRAETAPGGGALSAPAGASAAAGGLPADLPPTTGVPEGSSYKGDDGKVLAVLRGGKWVKP